MKKRIAIVILLLFFCSSCSNSDQAINNYHDENGNFIIEANGNRTVMTSELPISVPYNDKSITLTDVSFYQNCTDYSYNLFVVITMDVSELDDNEIHWLRESDIKVNSYITCDANGYDFDSASQLGSILWTDTKNLVFVKTSSFSKENRYGFESSEISTNIAVTQEDTFEYKDTELNKTEEITYETTIGDSITDAEQIEKPLYDYVSDWLRSKSDKLK